MNTDQLATIIDSHPDGLIVMEEHQASCGVGSAIIEQASDMYAQRKLATFPMVIRKAIKDEFIPIVGAQAYLRNAERLSL